MATAPYNHGVRVIDAGETERPISAADLSPIGICVPADGADEDAFPPNEPVHFFTNDAAKLAAIGADNPLRHAVDAIMVQGVTASVVAVRVEEGDDAEDTLANVAGSASDMTGIHALRYALGHTGVEPGLIIAPGFTSQRPGDAKNPVMAAAEGVAAALKAIAIGDCPSTTKEAALAYAADFSSRFVYLVDPAVRIFDEAGPIVRPTSAFAAGLFVKRDKEKGGPYHSPSNQAIAGIVGTARPITYYDGEIDHEANYLNKNKINTIIPATTIQSAGGAAAANGTILWGSETTSADALWRFVNVVRTRAAIEKAIPRAFRWAMDKNLSAQLGISVIRSLQIFLDELVAAGAILGGRAYWLKEMNSSQNLRSGILRVEFDAEEAPPLNDLQFGSRRNSIYFDTLSEDILSSLANV
jgi:phage tail sheath protein FI